ncbi:dynamin family protein [Falsibacillus pallidus]|uniref:dynamin family protein n=1 Tax=Falsibacillus pallidus TaxID=493781 RepID=UPI003D95DC1F
MENASKVQTETLLSEVYVLNKKFNQNGDIERAEKALLLSQKIYKGEFIAAFTGHFSAGKSTMINKLLGEQVLPSSPIPTSANLVKIRSGSEDYAMVHYRYRDPLMFPSPYDFKKIKEFCKNGEDVQSIEIEKNDSRIPKGVTVMDTPGVDSTDDAHRLSTESAIHLADIVFYVMDYNHVQSELNFVYTKELLKHGTELYLIVNQIDKHREEELDFHDFKDSVIRSFESWNVHPKGIFFTSTKDAQVPFNQFKEVQSLISEKMKEKDSFVHQSAVSAISRLKEEHEMWLKSEEESRLSPLKEILDSIPETDYLTMLEKEGRLEAELAQIKDKQENWKKSIGKEIDVLLKNAYLLPFETRSLAEAYLQSIQSDFKVGFLFGKKKTEEERKARLSAFYESLKVQVQSQLEWHLRQLFTDQYNALTLDAQSLLQQAQKIEVSFDEQLLMDMVKKGAGATGDYVLNYTNDIADALKKKAKEASVNLIGMFTEAISELGKAEEDRIYMKLGGIKEKADAVRKMMKISEETAEKTAFFNQGTEPNGSDFQLYISKLENAASNVEIYNADNEDEESSITDADRKSTQDVEEKLISASSNNISVSEMADNLRGAAAAIKGKVGFDKTSRLLMEKAERLGNRAFTISLFGAFSAGKSSFANALLGEKVLPVSPNPTTASINRICPPTEEYVHGTAVVHFKSKENMLADIQQSLKMFGSACSTLEEAVEKIPTILKGNNGEGKEKVHLSFLDAFQNGYGQYGSLLGEILSVDMEDFKGFVANERQSCFVESIDLHYDSALTRMGITLVDTPGADSINARHTGVSFEYIKNSDAILFVTYYNHAFSKADREFLIQLGRVKDAFELDKMFFIVNAIDLAESEDEKEEVLNYVNDQLLAYGIRNPRLYGVSSLLALQESSIGQSKIQQFSHAFESFLEHDLTAMAIDSAKRELEKVAERVNQIILSSEKSIEEKEKNKRALKESLAALMDVFSTADSDDILLRLEQETSELLHYVHQRVFFRFSDFFKEAFNPALLQKNDRKLLEAALEDLVSTLGFDFSQEMRATALRLENKSKKWLMSQFDDLQHKAKRINNELVFNLYQPADVQSMTFEDAFKEENLAYLEKTFKYFKNPKSFFEKNEKTMMQEDLERMLKPAAQNYLDEQKTKMEHSFGDYIKQEFSILLDSVKEDCHDQYKAWEEVLSQDVNVSEWKEIRMSLEKRI